MCNAIVGPFQVPYIDIFVSRLLDTNFEKLESFTKLELEKQLGLFLENDEPKKSAMF